MAALLCVHPHPDDETIACGGVLARSAAEGVDTMVVTCTGGEEGENLAGIELAGVAMEDVRRRELEDALEILGVGAHVWLGYRDSGMLGTPANDHPEAFARAELDEAAARLARILRRFRPDVVVCDDERGTYGHPDHVKAHEVTRRALALAASEELGDGSPWVVPKWYVHALPKSRVFAFHRTMVESGRPSPFGDAAATAPEELDFGVPDEQVTAEVDVRDWVPTKRAAMRAHRSQIGEGSFFLDISDAVATEVFGTEYFVLISGHVGVSQGRESDLFAGLDRR